MEYISIILQVLVAVSILNVWLVQRQKPTQWRGGNAQTLQEEFRVYGLPEWSLYAIGGLKVLLALALLLALWVPSLQRPAALGLAMLLLGSIAMHLKIGDPLKKSLPAFLFMCMCLYIAFPVV